MVTWLIHGLFVSAVRDVLLERDMRHWHIHDLVVHALRDAFLVRGPQNRRHWHIGVRSEMRSKGKFPVVRGTGISTISVRSKMRSWRGPNSLQKRHIDDLCALRDVLLDLGQGHAHDLLDDLFQSCDSLHRGNVRVLILPCQRRRRHLIFRVEEETAPTSEVGTGRPPPARRPIKMCSCLSRMWFHLGSSRAPKGHDLSQIATDSLSLSLSPSLSPSLPSYELPDEYIIEE